MPELDYLTTLTPKQHHALTLLAEGQSITAVAKTCGLHRTTIQHWKRTTTEFAYALQDACSENADHWRAASQQRAEASLTLIDTFLADPKIPATVRLKAALHILNAATAPPKFQHAYPEDPYRAAHQFLKQKQADEVDYDQFLRTSSSRNQHSSQFITSGDSVEAKKATMSASQPNSSLFITSEKEEDYKVATIRHPEPPTGRNAPCPCKSGKKFKHCCLNRKAA